MSNKKGKNYLGTLTNGIWNENPMLRLVLGTCPALAVTTSATNGLGMGLATMAVLIGSNILISLLRNIIPAKVRIPAYIVIISGFVTIVQLLMQAYVPALNAALGIYIPLIVVNCIILGRAESFSYKNGIVASFWDGIFQGFGYTVVLIIMCVIRELLGNGTFGGGLLGVDGKGIQIFPAEFGAGMLTLPVGGFLVLGALIAAMQWGLSKSKK